MRLARGIGLLLVTAGWACAADPGLVELIMPDAHLVIGMDFARIRTSAVGEMFRTGLQAGMQQAGAGAELQGVFAQLGFNPFDEIQELVVATTGAGKNPPTLVAMRGSARLRQLMESQVMRSRPGAPGLTSIGDILVGGDEAQVRAAKVRHGRGASLHGAMAKRIAEMSANYDVWVISNIPVSTLAQNMKDAKGPALGNMQALQSIEQFSAGIGMRNDFVLQIEAVTHDAKSAGALGDSVQMLLAMAQQGAAGKDPSAEDALKRVEFGVQGKVVRLGIKVPAEEMKKQMETFRARSAGAVRTTVAPPRAPATSDIIIQSSPKDMGTVVISGSKK